MNQIMNFMQTWKMFGEVWKLYKKYAVRKLSDAEIDQFTQEASKIHKRYKYPFTKEIVLAVIREIERSVKHFEEERNVSRKEIK